MKRLPKFTMKFEPATIEHLGLKLYTTLPPVIGELVSNSWDADANEVSIQLPEEINPDSEVVITDDGLGMSAEELQNAYLKIGRNRREATKTDVSKTKRRKLMGRKGLGKLSPFGIASEIDVRTVRDGHSVCIRLNYDEMKKCPEGKLYEPEIINEFTSKTSDKNGTEIRIRKLHRTRSINVEQIRKDLARRFTIIDDNFKVLVNGTQITYKDRRLKDACTVAWDVAELPKGGIIDKTAGWKAEGWMGLVEKSSQTERGVDIFASGKAVEQETMFGLPTTHIQFARAYVVGEVHANFLDAEEDNISTARNSVQWESTPGQKLQEWGQVAIKFVFAQWLELRQREKQERIVKTGDFEKWLSTRNSREKKVAGKLIRVIVQDQNIEPESAGPLLEIIKANVEFQAFQELVDELEDSGASVETLLTLFKDWRIIEARENLKLLDGRLEVMEKLSKFIDEGALEVKQIQPLFEENGWLVNPSWGHVSGQTTYTQVLRDNCKEPKDLEEKDRRMDILGYDAGGTVHVVELKRPEKTLSRKDLEQIEAYVDWARNNIIGTGQDSPKYISGLLIIGKLSDDKTIRDKMVRLAGTDIRVETFRDLLTRAQNTYGKAEKRLKKIAPEYSRESRKASKTRRK